MTKKELIKFINTLACNKETPILWLFQDLIIELKNYINDAEISDALCNFTLRQSARAITNFTKNINEKYK